MCFGELDFRIFRSSVDDDLGHLLEVVDVFLNEVHMATVDDLLYEISILLWSCYTLILLKLVLQCGESLVTRHKAVTR